MAEENNNSKNNGDTGTDLKDSVLELNFVPDWARKAPDKSYFDSDTDSRKRGPSNRDSRRRTPGRRDDQRKSRGPAKDQRRAPRDNRRDPRRMPPREQKIEIPAVNVRFLPQHKYLLEIMKRIKLSKKSHPLMEVASLFMANPESCDARIELKREEKKSLFQCKECGMVSFDENKLYQHMLKAHLEEYMVKEELEGEAPSGKFTCVAKCGLTGIFLGPPNHHSYANKIQEVHLARFAHMTLAEYKSHIETLHGEECIEQWKEQCRKQDVYKSKDAGENEEPMTWVKAEEYFRINIAPPLKKKVRHAILPVTLSRSIADRGLFFAIKEAWNKEIRFPILLMISLRGAFHHKGLNIFKAGKGKGILFVSPIKPAPLDPKHVVDSIREVLLYLKDNPGCSREKMLKELRPEAEKDSKEGKEILGPLSWLIERGHIIEFFNGTLSVPLK